jgi:hypothetical protein
MPQDLPHRPVVPQCHPSRRKHQSPTPRRAQTVHGHQIFSHLPFEKQTNLPAKTPPPPTPAISHHTTLDSPLSQNHDTNLLHHLVFRLHLLSPPTPSPHFHRALLISILTHDSLTSCALRKQHHHSPLSPATPSRKPQSLRFARPKQANKPFPLFPLPQATALTENQPPHSSLLLRLALDPSHSAQFFFLSTIPR